MIRRRRFRLVFPPVLAEALGIMSVLNQLGFRPTSLTIASGAIARTRAHHRVDTEGAAATDNLDTINGGRSGVDDLLLLSAVHTDRTVVVRDGEGNINLADAEDFSLDDTTARLLLIYDAEAAEWNEVSRSSLAGPTGPKGDPGVDGIPGYGTAICYDDVITGSDSVVAAGDYKLASTGALTTGITAWDAAKAAVQLEIHESAAQGTDNSGYLDSITVNDIVVLRYLPDRWISYRLTATPTKSGSVYTLALDPLGYDERGGAGALADGEMDITFSRGTGAAGQQGAAGDDGQPGYGRALGYDDVRTGSGQNTSGNGRYKLAKTGALSTGVSTWADAKAAVRLWLSPTDRDGTDESDYLDTIEVDDLVTLRLAADRWISYRATTAFTQSLGGFWYFDVMPVSHNEAGGTGALADGNVDFLFSRAQDGTDGTNGTDGATGASGATGPSGIPGYTRRATYDDIRLTTFTVNAAGRYKFTLVNSESGVANWENVKAAATLHLHEEDADNVYLGTYFGSLKSGDIVVFRLAEDRWIAYELTAAPTVSGDIWTLPISRISHDESGGTDAVADGDVEFLFSRSDVLALRAYRAGVYSEALAPR